MHNIKIAKCPLTKTSCLTILLIAAWLVGLLIGFLVSIYFGDTLVLCVSQALQQPGSSAVPFITVFPLLLSAFLVSIFPVGVLYLICMIRGASLAMMLQALAACFDSGACMAAVFLLFSALLFSPVLLWYWWRRLNLRMVHFRSDTVWCAVIGLAIGMFDLCFISPFLVEVMIL